MNVLCNKQGMKDEETKGIYISGDKNGMVIKMEKVRLEKQGRVLIPKKVRERLGLRVGEELAVNVENEEIVLKPFRSTADFSSELKGCIKEGTIDPLALKKMWGM